MSGGQAGWVRHMWATPTTMLGAYGLLVLSGCGSSAVTPAPEGAIPIRVLQDEVRVGTSA